MTVLYDQFGRPVPPTKRPAGRALAAAPVTDAWREYVADGLTPRRLATVFKEADNGDVRRQAELFDQMEERDGHLIGERSKRSNVILDVNFEVRPASQDGRDVKIAEFVEDYLANFTDWPDVLVSLQDAVGKGYAGLEIGWDITSGQALPQSFDFIEQKRFLFLDDKGILSPTPRLITDTASMGEDIPAWKMLFHRYGGKSGHPTRSGIMRVCAWMYLFKNYSIKDWVIFCEVFGMPLRLGKYDPGASEDDKRALAVALASIGTDAAGVISRDTAIEFIDKVQKTASGDLYSGLAGFANREMSKALLGQTLSAEVGDTGSYAAAKTHNEVRLDLLLADARAIAATVRHQVVRPIVGFNFGWDAPVPQYVAVYDEEEDLGKKSEWVGGLLDRGVTMPLSFVRREFNIPEPEGDEPVIGATPAAAQPPEPQAAKLRRIAAALKPGRQFSEEQQALEGLADDAMTRALANFAANEDKIRAAIATADSFEDAVRRVREIAPALDTDTLVEALEQSLLAAHLFGRYTAGGRE